jgi:hypothetical protein
MEPDAYAESEATFQWCIYQTFRFQDPDNIESEMYEKREKT